MQMPMMLLALALIASEPDVGDPALPVIEPAAAVRSQGSASASARASIRILRAARAGRDYGHEQPPGSRRMLIRAEGMDDMLADIQTIEFE